MSTANLVTNRRRAIAVAAIAIVLLGWFTYSRANAEREYTLHFADATKLHVGDKVTVLDVPLGKVLSVEPEVDRVTVRVAVDRDQPIPADATATIVAPTMVSVRHIELSPAWDGGPALADGATIPLERTASPVEWDEVQRQLTRFAEALGPDGANADGSLSRLISSAARNLDGQGRNLAQTLAALSDAMRTVSDHRGDLFATVGNLDVFVAALASADDTIHTFTNLLASVSQQLSEDSDVLVEAINSLGAALGDLNSFIADNGAAATRTVGNLAQVVTNLSNHRQHVADILQSAPTALSNYYNIYYPDARAMTGTFVGANLDDPATFICSSLYSLGGTPSDCESLLAPIADFLNVPVNPIGISPIDRNGGSGASAIPPADNRVTPPTPEAESTPTDPLDLVGSLMLGLVP